MGLKTERNTTSIFDAVKSHVMGENFIFFSIAHVFQNIKKKYYNLVFDCFTKVSFSTFYMLTCTSTTLFTSSQYIFYS